MNWDNQNNQDPWGRNNNNNDGPNFDDLMKQFSLLFGGNKNSTNGSGGSGNNFSFKRIFTYGIFGLLIIYASMCVYQLEAPERAVVLRLGTYYQETDEGLNFMIAGIDE